MILVILIVAALALFLVAVLGQRSLRRRIWIAGLGVLLIASVGAIAANDASRFGMTTKVFTQTTEIVGAADHTILTVPIGTAKQNLAVVYRKNPLSKKVSVAKPGVNTDVKLHRTNSRQAHVTIKRTELRYKDTFAAFLFAGSGQNGQVLTTTYDFAIPQSWRVSERK
ncbi:DUF4811 domain-containing protein [Lacticaseibacillus camelliae]|uniref:DUF4811 domain-containing protein n=1 Tax=Lacticaseibacillus camelliae DSM 22697 = JCM 13995 TaxID=1423730 RepID=A0A0R2F526_9LACO|nr:DUF4811 domain-containing protein [Lacticaseibacillus camelliae]KRN23363.1 hypothetical protein FC75_GL001563 [Lacticaseibacillus camelliae DSM 22697 = JCM 13995]